MEARQKVLGAKEEEEENGDKKAEVNEDGPRELNFWSREMLQRILLSVQLSAVMIKLSSCSSLLASLRWTRRGGLGETRRGTAAVVQSAQSAV